MRPMWAYRSTLRPAEIHPALRSFADECTAVAARLLAYVGALALIAIVGKQVLSNLPIGSASSTPRPGWSLASRSYPAFAVTQVDSSLKANTYDIFRHPGGGRKDVLRWAADPGEKPAAELELYRPGSEAREAGPPIAEVAARMGPDEMRDIEAAGVIDSKFGYVSLLGFTDKTGDRPPCLGFMKNVDDANLRISGWSCQAGPPQVRRTAIGCILDHLILLTAGNDPKLAELFAHAELRRGACATRATSTVSADWVTGPENPGLRGAL
ncbi:MAG: hypothetical protein JSS22_01285 [Proteobacteria bacterium]|nr:hypothetical protein [Pseudomonadota bacterium]